MKYVCMLLASLVVPCFAQDAKPEKGQDDPAAEILRLIEKGELDGVEKMITQAQRANQKNSAINRTRLVFAGALSDAGDHYEAADQYARFFRSTLTRPAGISRNMDKALASLDKAMEAGKSGKTLALRRSFASAFAKMRDYKSAAEQYEQLLSSQLELDEISNAALLASLTSVQSYFSLARRADEVLPLAEQVDERVSKSTKTLADKVVGLRVHAIKAKAMSNEAPKAAKQLLLADYEAAKKTYDSEDDDSAALYAWSLNNLYTLNPTDEDAQTYFQAHQEITKDLAMKSRNFEMFRNYMSLATRDISTTYRAEPKTAELSVQKLKAAIDDFRESRPEYKAMLTGYERSISNYERRIASALKILEMIGQPAPEMDVAAWVTQDGDKPVDLNGKVILLDFYQRIPPQKEV
ncbi:MAG: hypothetical protein AB8G99_24800 [Planctomycetaceae bacterium]